mgnify:CR=1 FL=1
MQLRRLTLTQFRAFEQAEFEFQPGMNLLVGVNGVGKSTVLDALRILLSQILPKFTSSKDTVRNFGIDDIKIERKELKAELDFTLFIESSSPLFGAAESIVSFKYSVSQPREKYVENKKRVGTVREQTISQFATKELRPNERTISKFSKERINQSIAVYFSTRRSLPSTAQGSKTKSMGYQAFAFADALAPGRALRIREFADWWLTRQVLSNQSGETQYLEYLDVLQETVESFMSNCRNLRAVSEPETTLLLEKNGTTLDVRQLSDGERGMLALVLDLGRRLALANTGSDDPLRDGKAVVLIDELDLHLHPRWQRDIVRKLTETFPNCQFIATTHSPQIVGEVAPEKIILLEEGKPPYPPNQSLGMDTNWILKRLMGTDEREAKTQKDLAKIARLIENEKYDQATKAIDKLRARLGEFPELVRLRTRIDRIQFLGK